MLRDKVNQRFIVDAHLDLSMNAIEWNRDLTQPLDVIRQRELFKSDKPDRGNGTVCLPELRKGNIGLVVATQLSRVSPPGSKLAGWQSPQQAWAMTQAQLTWYKEMEKLGEMKNIQCKSDLENHLMYWNNGEANDSKAIGYILSLEGADSLIHTDYLEEAYAYGLRAVGLSHFGPGRYAPGTKMTGPLSEKGRALLKQMSRLKMILDVTHLTDEGFDEVMDSYEGPIWASHHNVRAIVPNQRQLKDEQIKKLISREAVIGGMLDCWAMDVRFIDTVSDPWQLDIKLEKLVDHWDHICQIAGSSSFIGIGSDLDGIFGTEQAPWDLNSIADLQKFDHILQNRGFSNKDIDAIFHGNWLTFLRKNLD